MIRIRVVSRSGVPLDSLPIGVPVTARFGDAVGDIGRGADCTLVLPDPDRQISRKQALITCQGSQHFICPIGSNFAVELDGVPLAQNVETALEVGSEIRIGPYLLRVEDAPLEAPSTLHPPVTVTPAPGERQVRRSADDPLAIFGEPKRAARASVFSDLLESSISAAAPAVTPAAVPGQAPPARPPRQKKKAVGPESAAEIADAARQVDLDVGEPTGPDARKSARRPRSTSVALRSKQEGQKDQGIAADDLVAPLFAALGVPAPDDRAQGARQMRLIGELLRAAIGGTLELLAARSIAKRELGANATQLQARENNPLKFSPDTDAALAHLLGPTARGFIAPLEAVREAFGDLRAHQVAILTGMRAALDEVLARFDPAALEPRLADDDLWDKLVPTNRKAKMWEQYTQQYAQILREVEGDFDTLFGRAFLRAYQAQLAEFARASDLNARDES